MAVRGLNLNDFEAEWPRLTQLLRDADGDALKSRMLKLLGGERAYAILDEAAGQPSGVALVEHYQSAWIFDDRVASIRECITADAEARARLLAAIDGRARSAHMTHLQRFLTASDESLSWWYGEGFVEYMTAFRKPIEASAGCQNVDDSIAIRAVSDPEADWPKLWPLFSRLDEHHAALTGRPLHERRESDARRYLQEEIDGGESLVLVAEAEGEAIATSTAELGQQETDGTRIGYRSRLYVDEAHRGRHLSQRFEDIALPWFLEREVTHVERWIVGGNELPRQIWTARGYTPARILLRKALPE